MITKSRIIVDFSMSVLERTEAGKLIKAYEKESIKPYGSMGFIKRAAGYIFIFAAMFTLLQMIMQIIDAPHDDSMMARTRVINIILLALFALSLALFNLYDRLLCKAMKKNAAVEQTDDELAQRVKLTRYYVENITHSATGRVYWEYIKTSYRKGGFIFIHMRNDNCIVIPERVFTSESEAAGAVDFIHAQIAWRKQQAG